MRPTSTEAEVEPRKASTDPVDAVSVVRIEQAEMRVLLGRTVPNAVLAAIAGLAPTAEGTLHVRDEAGVPWAARVAVDGAGRVAVCAPARRAEVAAAERAILEATNDGVWVVGPDFRTSWTNRALESMLGYSAEELTSRTPADLAHPEDEAHVGTEQESRREGESTVGEVRMLAKDGRTVWVLHSSAPIRDVDGTFLGAIAILKDVTEHKAAQDRAQEVHRLEVLARLAGGIAHDFNNLLTAVVTGAEMLSAELPPSSAASETVDTIRSAGQRAAVLCRQLLGLSGRGRFSLAPVDPFVAASDAVRALRPSLDARHRVTIARGDDCPAVAADEAQLQQLVTNLILNASEAIGPRAGTIRVTVERVVAPSAMLAEAHLSPELPAGPYACISVSDDGPGLADEVRGRLFEPFVTTRTAGRGLGLAAVLGIVRGHRGAVRVDTDSGRGTTFEVLLPVAASPVAKRSRPPHQARDGEGRLVLVVDDEPMVRAAACRALVSRGFRTLDAEDGISGIEVFRANAERIDAVLLDLSMPNVDGVETLVRIREIRPGTPAVIMSGYSEDETAARFVGVGLATFVAKPFTPDQLVQRLKSALGAPLIRT